MDLVIAARPGALATPEFTAFRWGATITRTSLAGGGAFRAAGEPTARFPSPPPISSAEAGAARAVGPAPAQSLPHRGLLAWSIPGALAAIGAIAVMLAAVAPIVMNIWLTIVGGTGIAHELAEPGAEGFDLPAAPLAIAGAPPLGFPVSVLFLVPTTIFVASAGDSMTNVIAVAVSRDDDPAMAVRVFRGVAMGAVAMVPTSAGSGGVGELRSFVVVAAVPASLVLLPSLRDALRITLMKGREAR